MAATLLNEELESPENTAKEIAKEFNAFGYTQEAQISNCRSSSLRMI